MKFFSVVGYALMVLALLALVMVHGLFSSSIVIIAIQALAVALMVWARITFGSRSFHYAANPTEGGLVTKGPYHYIRHPIYAAIVYFTLASVIGNWSLGNALLWILVCAGAAVRIYCEETLLVQQYPEYVDYAKKTKRIVPFVF